MAASKPYFYKPNKEFLYAQLYQVQVRQAVRRLRQAVRRLRKAVRKACLMRQC